MLFFNKKRKEQSVAPRKKGWTPPEKDKIIVDGVSYNVYLKKVSRKAFGNSVVLSTDKVHGLEMSVCIDGPAFEDSICWFGEEQYRALLEKLHDKIKRTNALFKKTIKVGNMEKDKVYRLWTDSYGSLEVYRLYGPSAEHPDKVVLECILMNTASFGTGRLTYHAKDSLCFYDELATLRWKRGQA